MEMSEVQKERGEKLIEDHIKYQEGSFDAIGLTDEQVTRETLLFFCREYMRHGYKHGIEDEPKVGRPRKPRQPKNQAAMFPKEVIEE